VESGAENYHAPTWVEVGWGQSWLPIMVMKNWAHPAAVGYRVVVRVTA